eukprot:Clim_evm33s157 gene=Clim_evmTU33s157
MLRLASARQARVQYLQVARAGALRIHTSAAHPSIAIPVGIKQQDEQSIGFDTIDEQKVRVNGSLESLQRTKPLYGYRLSELPQIYSNLSKIKLSTLVVLTTMAGYAVAPGPLSLSMLMHTTAGTALCVASANSLNQFIEYPYDSQMSRTRTRPLVTGKISPLHALTFGAVTGVTGVATLAELVNPTVALLGAGNIALYAFAYTSMKRTSIANTWVGALVGGIPPMMGWAAATGSLDPAAWVLGGLLYAWQFPHFNALSWNLRQDYAQAGYRMMSITDPDLCRRTALRYSLACFPLSLALPALGVCNPWFAVTSSLVNAYMSIEAVRFYRNADSGSARKLFFASIVHLPVLMALVVLHRKSDDDREEEQREYSLQHSKKFLQAASGNTAGDAALVQDDKYGLFKYCPTPYYRWIQQLIG